MTAFIDPRNKPVSPYDGPTRPLADDWADIEGLVAACKQGRLYDVEAWIARGQPLQVRPDVRPPSRRTASALGLAIAGSHHRA